LYWYCSDDDNLQGVEDMSAKDKISSACAKASTVCFVQWAGPAMVAICNLLAAGFCILFSATIANIQHDECSKRALLVFIKRFLLMIILAVAIMYTSLYVSGAAARLGSAMLGLAAVSVSLHGCSLGIRRHHKHDDDDPSGDVTITSTTVPDENMTTTTTTTPSGGALKEHCAQWAEEDLICSRCEEGYELDSGRCFFSCQSDMEVLDVVNPSGKGVCLDDTTLSDCSDQIPFKWPNTKERITSMRLFTAWQSTWPEEGREAATDQLVRFIRSNGVKVLVGTQITCDEEADDRDWHHVLELVHKIGPDHLMGLAVGNEMELYSQKAWVRENRSCIHNIWEGGYFWNKTVARVSELDLLFEEESRKVPVTSVFGGFILGGEPFVDIPDARVLSYIQNATQEFGSRWAFSLNIYPYFDPGNALDPGSEHECNATIARCLCLDGPNCLMSSIVSSMRRKIKAVTGNDDDILWIGETGWSYPMSSTLSSPVKNCPDFSSRHTFETSYRNFLSWDLQLKGVRGPDHIFYFTMRDSVNFGMSEHFGLVDSCGETTCKLQKEAGPNGTAATDLEDDIFVAGRASGAAGLEEIVV